MLTACVLAASLAAGPDQKLIDDVKALLQKQIEAWNKGDLDAFAEGYADDATFISPSGLTQGKEQVVARYKKRYPDRKAMGTLSFEYVELRPGHQVTSLVARWKLSYPDKPEAKGLTLLVLHASGDSWRIVEDA